MKKRRSTSADKDPRGNLHPITQMKNQMVNIFAGMGFEIYEGTEIENDYYNFTALNTPMDHPARDMQDTFYLSPEYLLRTQTSAGQIHVMEAKKPPIKILSPGKVFRSDDDATHSPMFSQMEGLVVDKGITLCDLQGMLDEFVQQVYGEGTRTRLRPSFFPFTEPSVEVDCSCFAVLSTTRFWRTAVLTPMSTAALHSVSVSSAQPCSSTASTTSSSCSSPTFASLSRSMTPDAGKGGYRL